MHDGNRFSHRRRQYLGHLGVEYMKAAADDRSGLLLDFWGNHTAFVRVFCPPKFGKTSALKTLQAFFDVHRPTDARFDDRTMTNHDDLKAQRNQHPVVYLDFGLLDGASETALANSLNHLLHGIWEQWRMKIGGRSGFEDQPEFGALIQKIQDWHGRNVLVLIDNEDRPILQSMQHGFGEAGRRMVGEVMSALFKDNPALGKGLTMGTLPFHITLGDGGANNMVCQTLNIRHGMQRGLGFDAEDLSRLKLCSKTRESLIDRFGRIGRPELVHPFGVWQTLDEAPPQSWLTMADMAPIMPQLLADPRLCEELLEGKTVETNDFSFDAPRSAMPLWREGILAYLTHLGVCRPSKVTDSKWVYCLTNGEAKRIMASTLAL